MKKLFFFSILIIFATFSCADINRSNQIKNVDTMIKYLDSVSSIINLFKPDSLSRMANNSTNVELRIKNYLINDTIDLELGKKMDAYKIMRRSIGVLRKNNSKIKALVKEEIIELNKLKSDINNGSGRREKRKRRGLELIQYCASGLLMSWLTSPQTTGSSAEFCGETMSWWKPDSERELGPDWSESNRSNSSCDGFPPCSRFHSFTNVSRSIPVPASGTYF